MSSHVTFLVLGMGSGAVIALLAVGVVITYRASGVINFAHAALGMYVAFAYYELRATGDLVQPILGLPARIHLVDRPTEATALAIAIVVAALLGALVYALVFSHLRSAPPLARLVASLGLLLYLIAIVDLRFSGRGSAALVIEGPLPNDLITFGGIRAPADRYWLAAIAVGGTFILWLVYRFTRFGLSTRAVATNRPGAQLLGIDAGRVAIANWMLASVLAGLAIILAAPITRLDPTATSLLIVPALAAALPGRFRSMWSALVFGLAIGMLQSEILNVQADYEWLSGIGLQQGLPFLIVLVTLFVRSDRMPERGQVGEVRLPAAPPVGRLVGVAVGVSLAAILGLAVLDSAWRLGIIISAIATVMSLSVVVLTGYVGQISLATYAFAGVAAFAMVRFADDAGLGFPLAPILGIATAMLVGMAAGVVALRIRGMELAIATLAAAVAIEELVFKWSWFTGGFEGATAESPELLGIDLGIAAVGDAFPRRAFGVMVVVIALLATISVAALRAGPVGRRWLAVRSDERAAYASGISVGRVKLTAFALSALFAGLAGTLLAYQRQIVSVSSFTVFQSIVIIAITYLAGIATAGGALLAGALAAGGVLTAGLEKLSEGSSDYQFAVFGLLLMVAAVRFPAGVLGHRRPKPAPPEAAEPIGESADEAA